MLDKEILQYKVGGLLYMPAFQKNIVQKISEHKLPQLTAAAFCLEDSIRDKSLPAAESALKDTLRQLEELEIDLPLIFVRIRSPRHLENFHSRIGSRSKILTGYILPKFDLNNVTEYVAFAKIVNFDRMNPLYIMPTFETEQILSLSTRRETLTELYSRLSRVRDLVLNIRVGVNDFCKIYSLRRNIDQTIYDIGIVRDALIDILNVFAKDFVVSGGVWNYFNGDNGGAWAKGLKRELELDRANGFIGKSAIHPAQLPFIFDSLKVSRTDLNDAKQLLDWKSDELGVQKSSDGSRMNEFNCHLNWARRIKLLSELYGVKEESLRTRQKKFYGSLRD